MRLGALRSRPRIAAVVACVAISTVVAAQQGDRSQTEALARRASERLQSLQREADRLASEERTLLNELRRLELDRQIKAESASRIAVQAQQVAAELTATTSRIAELEQQDLAERPDVRARFVEMYKLGR